jgi:CRISPR-associated protein Cmx8
MPKTQTLDFNLAELPSAQHRAGLAGLVLMIQELQRWPWFKKRQQEDGALINVKNIDQYGAEIELNQAGLTALFDLAYLAQTEERKSKSKIKNHIRIDEVETTDKKGKPKVEKYYVYEVVTPDGAFLEDWDRSEKQVWIKIWRDMFWSIIKGVPATRNSFISRCDFNLPNGDSFSKDSNSVWNSLKKPENTTGQSGAFYLGAMAVNAENVPTQDLVKWQFLLHFWAFVAQVYCPSIIDKDGKRNFNGYVIVVPDVSNLKNFCRKLPTVLRSRSPEALGYRPKESIIDAPEESVLDLLSLIQATMADEIKSQGFRNLILGAEIIHAEKQGNSIKIHSHSYVQPFSDKVMNTYQNIKKLYWCPWFRRQRLINLLHDQAPWYGFDEVLSCVPRKWLWENNSYFSHDARKLFTQEGGFEMNSTTSKTREYAKIVYDIAQGFVLSKLANKYELKWKECKGNPKLEREYDEKKEKVVNEAFLAIRSRTEKQVFIDYFVSTLYPFVRKDEFADFAEKLFQQTDEIRALTLLALSSQYPLKKKEEEKNSDA